MDAIKKSLIIYYKYKYKFEKLFPKISSIKYDDDKSDLIESIVIINNTKFNYCILGRFDKSTNFWEWGWSFERVKNKTYAIRDFLNYGLENYDDEFEIIRQMIINSKFKIDEKFNLDIILAISARFIFKSGYIYIHEIKESNNISKFMILKLFK